jgi:hypothetical protein
MSLRRQCSSWITSATRVHPFAQAIELIQLATELRERDQRGGSDAGGVHVVGRRTAYVDAVEQHASVVASSSMRTASAGTFGMLK